MAVKVSSDDAPLVPLERPSAITSARRAMIADRYAVDSFAVEWRTLAELQSITGEWRDLAARALEPNVFYEPAFALAAASVFGRDVGTVLVWSGTSPRQLLGFFPARIQHRRYGIKLPVLVGWTHPYAPFGMPLIEREAAEPVITAWLEYLAADPALPGLVLLPFVTEEGPFAAALAAILRRAQMPDADFNRHRRALLASGGDGSLYVEHVLGARRLRELRRIGRRMADAGAVLYTAATEPSAVTAALKDFLALEASGWKGKAGTAAALHDELSVFIKSAVCGLAAEGKVAINRLLLDGRPIAATIALRSADAVWFWKMAYDEAFARFSPGVMLAVAVTDELVEDATVLRTDSCATANHPIMDRIWRERLALHDLLVAVRPQAPFARACRLETLRRGAFTRAASLKRIAARLRR